MGTPTTYGPSDHQIRFQSLEKEIADLRNQIAAQDIRYLELKTQFNVMMGVMQLKLAAPENQCVSPATTTTTKTQ